MKTFVLPGMVNCGKVNNVGRLWKIRVTVVRFVFVQTHLSAVFLLLVMILFLLVWGRGGRGKTFTKGNLCSAL